MSISTHVLDIAQGHPAQGIPVRLERQEASGKWQSLASAHTDRDGRCLQLLPNNEALTAGTYRLSFDTAAYFHEGKLEGLYPSVQITFEIRNGEKRFHLPLLLSPNGYTTYRGS
jgi:5-hydroxyisourate hydrolase